MEQCLDKSAFAAARCTYQRVVAARRKVDDQRQLALVFGVVDAAHSGGKLPPCRLFWPLRGGRQHRAACRVNALGQRGGLRGGRTAPPGLEQGKHLVAAHLQIPAPSPGQGRRVGAVEHFHTVLFVLHTQTQAEAGVAQNIFVHIACWALGG